MFRYLSLCKQPPDLSVQSNGWPLYHPHGFCGSGMLTGHSRDDLFLPHEVWASAGRTPMSGPDQLGTGDPF